MGVYLRAKFEVSSIILTSFRHEGEVVVLHPPPTPPTPPPPQNEPLKSPPRLGLNVKRVKIDKSGDESFT